MNERWRLLDEQTTDPYLNMAIEEALMVSCMESGFQPTMRFWRNRESVILGVFQDPKLEVDLEACQRDHVAVVRRFTGGGTVYHDEGNLNWSFFIPRGHALLHSLASLGIMAIFRKLSSVVVRGLADLGIDAEFRPPNALIVDGAKVSGMAGSVRRSSVLCHGTLLIDSDLERLSKLLSPSWQRSSDDLPRFVRSNPMWVTTLSVALSRPVSIEEAKQALVKGAEEAFVVELTRGSLMKSEEDLANQLWSKKYTRNEWNSSRDFPSSPLPPAPDS